MMKKQNQSIHQSLDQIRARGAWDFVSNAQQQLSDKNFKNYVSLVKKFPAMINNNGLGQALAFIYSKTNFDQMNPEAVLFENLQSWLTEKDHFDSISHYSPPYPQQQKSGHQTEKDYLLTCIMTNSSKIYLRATIESLALLDKLRNFASGKLKQGEQHGKKEDEK